MPKTSKLNIQQLIEEYDDVDMFFANVIFLKAPSRTMKFKEIAPGLPLKSVLFKNEGYSVVKNLSTALNQQYCHRLLYLIEITSVISVFYLSHHVEHLFQFTHVGMIEVGHFHLKHVVLKFLSILILFVSFLLYYYDCFY